MPLSAALHAFVARGPNHIPMRISHRRLGHHQIVRELAAPAAAPRFAVSGPRLKGRDGNLGRLFELFAFPLDFVFQLLSLRHTHLLVRALGELLQS